jgi:acetyl esterase/lipase
MYPFADYFRRLGMLAVSVEYRLLDRNAKSTVFDCVRDGRSAVRHLRSHADALGIDPNRIVVSGCSAGGHVAAGTAQFDEINDELDDTSVSSVPNALVLYYPVIDTSVLGYGQEKIGELWEQISPVHRVRPGLPPTLVFHGTDDTVTPYAGALAFQQKMQNAGNDCELVTGEGGKHGYLIFDLTDYRESMARTRAFLAARDFLSIEANP